MFPEDIKKFIIESNKEKNLKKEFENMKNSDMVPGGSVSGSQYGSGAGGRMSSSMPPGSNLTQQQMYTQMSSQGAIQTQQQNGNKN